MDSPFHLPAVLGISAFSGRIVAAAKLHHLSGIRILHHFLTADEVGIPEADLPSGSQAEEVRRRVLHEIVGLDVELPGKRHHPGAFPRHVAGVGWGIELLPFPFRVVGDHELERAENAHDPGHRPVQMISDGELEFSQVHPIVRFGHTDHLGKSTNGLGRDASAAHPGDGRHPRIIPPLHVPLVHQPQEFPLAHDRVVQVQAGKLVLVGPGFFEPHLVQQPVVDLPVVVELQGTEGVGDAFESVGEAVGEVVQGVDAPFVPPAVMGGVTDPIQNRIPHDHVGVGHVDLGPQNMFPVSELALLHAAKEVQVLLNGSVPEGTVSAGLVYRSPIVPDFLFRKGIHVGLPLLDKNQGAFVEALEVVRSEVEVLTPVETQPTDVLLDGADVFHVLGEGVGVVEAEVADSPVLLSQTEVQDNGFGVADVQIAVGLRREPGFHPSPVGPLFLVRRHDGPDEVRSFSATPVTPFRCHGPASPSLIATIWRPIKVGNQSSARERARQALIPPKPNELLRAWRMAPRAWP